EREKQAREWTADLLKPPDGKDVGAAVQWTLGESKTLEIVSHGSKRGIGRAAQWDLSLDLSDLSGVTLYEPQELILSAKAGTPIAEIETLLAANNQELAFEPIDYGPVFGAVPNLDGTSRGTIGGALAANLSGPRRIKAGAARDPFPAVTAVAGRGRTFQAGGRAEAGGPLTALRLEGVAPSVAHRRRALEQLLKPLGEIAVLEEAASRDVWRVIRNVMPFTGGARALWRISVAPSRGHQVAAAIAD